MTIAENWMSENLCSFDELTRIELSPQLIELMCNDDNLSNAVTSAHYSLGRIDALGKVIVQGEMMTCVDWRCRHKSKIWKIYQINENGFFDKVDEQESKEAALTIAKTLAGEM